jgi:holin-like protein
MIGAFAVLLGFQLSGEMLVRLLNLPVPGPVLGMTLLLLALLARGAAPTALATTARGLLACLALLFVPAGVGIIVHGERVAAEWLPLAVTLVASTAITMVVTGWTLFALMRRQER